MLELFAKYTWEDVNITGKPAQVYLWESLCKELWIKMIITVCSPWEYQGGKKEKKKSCYCSFELNQIVPS